MLTIQVHAAPTEYIVNIKYLVGTNRKATKFAGNQKAQPAFKLRHHSSLTYDAAYSNV